MPGAWRCTCLSAEIRGAVQPGALIAVYGVRPRHAEMIAAVAIEAGPGKRIVDNGPPKKDGEHGKEGHDGPKHGAKAQHAAMEAEGMVQRSLHGPKGEVRGALLEDGRIIRVPPHEAKECEPLLKPGARLAIRGAGLRVDGVTVIDARELGASMTSLKPMKPEAPRSIPSRTRTTGSIRSTPDTTSGRPRAAAALPILKFMSLAQVGPIGRLPANTSA